MLQAHPKTKPKTAFLFAKVEKVSYLMQCQKEELTRDEQPCH